MSSQFYRLLWKEYRAQRSLWLVLAFCLVLLQTTIAVVSSPAVEISVLQLLVFPHLIVSCFAVASVALLFAGEEDLGTAIWLRQFPVRTGTLFWSKAWASFLGTFGMTILGLASTAILVAARHGKFEISSLDYPSLAVVAIFLVSLFWSLQCRSVFMSLGLSSATVFFGSMLASTNDSDIPLQFTVLAPLAVVCLTLYPLAKRWHRGLRGTAKPRRVAGYVSANVAASVDRFLKSTKPLPQTLRVLGVFVAIPLIGAIGLVILVTGLYLPWLFVFVVLAAFIAAVRALLRSSFGWAAWLKSAASGSTQLKRTTSVLMWRECRFALPFGAVVIGIGILATMCRLWVEHDTNWGLLVLTAVVIECGLRTFRHDQQKQHGLFWGHRGVSPVLVWGVRNVVWLGTLLTVAMVFVIIDLPAVPNRPLTTQERMIDIMTQVTQSPEFRRVNIETPLEVNVPRQLSVWLSWLLGGFFLSQLCSCWIRKPLIAFFIALTTFGAYTAWGLHTLIRDLPPSLALWPIVFFAATAVLLSRRQWMDRRFSFGVGAKRVAFLLIPLLCLWPVKAAWRIFQLPQDGRWLMTNEKLSGYSSANQNSQWADSWQKLNVATQSLQSSRTNFETYAALDARQLQQAQDAIEVIWSKHTHQQLPPKWKLPWADYPAQPLAFAVIQHAEAELQNDSPINALTALVQGTHLLRFLKRESSSWDQYAWCGELEQLLLQQIHHIAADDRLTAHQLKLAARDMLQFLNAPIPVDEMLANRQVVYSSMLRRQGYLWETEGQHVSGSEVFDASFSERMRFLYLMTLSDRHTLGLDAGANRHDLYRWAATTVTEPSDLLQDPVFADIPQELANYLSSGFTPLFRQQQTELTSAEQATWVILQMQAYRRVHDEFPDDLESFLPYPVERKGNSAFTILDGLRDPFQFRYSKSGRSDSSYSLGNDAGRTFISGGQPLLWTASAQLFLQHEYKPEGDIRSVVLNRNRIVYLDGSGAVPPAGGIGRLPLNTAETDEK
jgi:type II secretory pathway pseudopilin PulG